MIDNRYGKYVPVCDTCGEELEPQDTYQDALDIMQEYNWESRRNNDGAWENYCEVCFND